MEDIVKITSDNTKLIMQPYANWEEYLVPAPVSIAILGELVCISSNVDFSINKNPTKDGFQYIKNPDSFRACLMQVANSVSAAFNEAHRNMDQIRLNTGYMTAYIKTSMKVLLQENDELVQTLLPDHLEIITTISDECVELADQTERKFTITIYLIEELLGAYLSTRKHILERDNEYVQRKCEDKEIDFKTTIKILVKGLDAMGRVKEECEKMVHFFQMVSNRLQESPGVRLTSPSKVKEEEKEDKPGVSPKITSISQLWGRVCLHVFPLCQVRALQRHEFVNLCFPNCRHGDM